MSSETPALKVSKPRRSLEDKIWWENMRKWYEYSQDGPMTSSPYHHSWHVYYKYVLLIQHSLLVNECPSPIDTKKISSENISKALLVDTWSRGNYFVVEKQFCCFISPEEMSSRIMCLSILLQPLFLIPIPHEYPHIMVGEPPLILA